MANRWIVIAAMSGSTAVALGALGAHFLKSRLTETSLAAFEVGVRYQMYHAIALLVVALLASTRSSSWLTGSAWCMTIGTVFFSGSLYGLTLFQWKWLGPITPVGGLLLIVGWLLLIGGAYRSPSAG